MRVLGAVLGIVLAAGACAASAATSARSPGEITFTAAKTSPKRDAIYGVRSDGSGLRTILRDAARPAWSPDGKRFAYYGGAGCRGFCVADANGRNRRLLFGADCGSGSDVAWSRDGTRLALACAPGARIVVVRANGTTARRVRSVTGTGFPQIGGLAWSPDGRTIAYYTTRLQKGKLRGAIEIAKPDGSKTMRLSTVRNLSAVSARASWTRDGTTLAFQLDPDFVGLFDFGRRVVANVVGGSSPAFSPDGTKLAFEQDGDIFVAAAGKPKAAQVVKGGAAPVWSPDSRALAFVAQGGRVGVVNADGSGGRFVTGRYVDLLDVAWRR